MRNKIKETEEEESYISVPVSSCFSGSAGSLEMAAWLSFSVSSSCSCSCSFFWGGLASKLGGFSGLSPMLLRGDCISISSPQSVTGWWLSSGENGLRGFPPSGDS